MNRALCDRAAGRRDCEHRLIRAPARAGRTLGESGAEELVVGGGLGRVPRKRLIRRRPTAPTSF